MAGLLAEHFRAARERAGLGQGQLAVCVGYKNLNKGIRHIGEFEGGGAVDMGLLRKLAEALQVDWATVELLARQDYQAFLRHWIQWVNEPIEPYVVVKLIPGFYSHVGVPPDLTTDQEREEFACAKARDSRRKCCLVLSRRASVWIDEKGAISRRTEAEPGMPNGPFMCIGGGSGQFLLGMEEGISVHDASWLKNVTPAKLTKETGRENDHSRTDGDDRTTGT